MSELGERVASLAASFEALEKYEHERWHKLNNDLQPLILMPQHIARDMAKLEARLDTKFGDRLTAIESRLSGPTAPSALFVSSGPMSRRPSSLSSQARFAALVRGRGGDE